jgi:DNA-binding MurR/RpiR family transcriptional regulator
MNLIKFTDELDNGICITAKIGSDLNDKLNRIALEVGVSKAAVVRTLLKYGILNYNKQK